MTEELLTRLLKTNIIRKSTNKFNYQVHTYHCVEYRISAINVSSVESSAHIRMIFTINCKYWARKHTSYQNL